MLGFNHAFRGLFQMLRKERNFKIQFLIFTVVVVFGFSLDISRNDWISLLIISGLVLSLEIMNSAIEKICDLYSKEKNPKIKNIKDISAGAVLIAALVAIVAGTLLFYPYLNK
jgi:diacylglycerol kinase